MRNYYLSERVREALRAFSESADLLALDGAMEEEGLDYEILLSLEDEISVPWVGSLVESVSRFVIEKAASDLANGGTRFSLYHPSAVSDALIADAISLFEAGARTSEYMREALLALGVEAELCSS